MEHRPYQQKMIQSAIDAYNTGKQRFLLVVPTGGGKTYMAKCILEKLHPKKALFLAHTKTLVQQAQNTLGSLAACMTIQKLSRESQKREVDIIIIDEAHHALAPSYRGLLDKYPSTFFFGLTATPDRDGIGHIFPDMCAVSIEELMEGGYLAPVKAYALTGLTAAADVVLSNGDFQIVSLSKACNTPCRNNFIVEQYLDKAKDCPAIAFCVDVQHAKDLSDAFCAKGVRSIAVHGGLSEEMLEYCYEQFRLGHISVLTSCILLTEGFDVPKTSCVLLCRPTLSDILFRQMVGRCLRLSPNKTYATVLDFVYDGHSLGRAKNITSFPCQELNIRLIQEEVTDSIGTITRRERSLDPIEYINKEYDLMGDAALDKPYLISWKKGMALVGCRPQKAGYKYGLPDFRYVWDRCLVIVRFPSPPRTTQFTAYAIRKSTNHIQVEAKEKSLSMDEAIFGAIVKAGMDIQTDRRWAKMHAGRITDGKTLYKLERFNRPKIVRSLAAESELIRCTLLGFNEEMLDK
jgi:hypothetical protein